MSEDTLADFVGLLNKEANAYATASIGTDLSLSSHVPFGIPTRIPQLDLSLGRPGFPVGRVIELFGFQGSGKTTVGLHALAAAQALGGLAHFVDAEKCWDPLRARQCGVQPEQVVLSECDSIEAIFRTIEHSANGLEKLKWTKPYVIVVDSVTAVISENEFSKEIGEEYRLGQDARTIRLALRKLTSRISENNMCVIFVNHATEKIGVTFGEKSTSAGGRAIKFFASVRVFMSFMNQIFDGKGEDRTRLGQSTKFTIKKNKVNATGKPDFKVPLLDHGFDIYAGLFEALKDIGAIEKINQKTWLFKPTETQISKADWPVLVDERGGPWEVYDWFLQIAQDKGFIKPYGIIDA